MASENINTANCFYMNPLKITVKEGLERYRKDLGDLKELGNSLKTVGQIQPTVINYKHELIAGGRRLAACILENIDVKVIYEDIVDPKLMRIWEIEENVRRKDFTPAENAIATKEFHTLMQERNGKSVSGKMGGHTLEATAKMLGKTKGYVINEIEMAEMVKAFPELKNAKKKSTIKKAAKGLMKLDIALKGLENLKEAKINNAFFQLHHLDAKEHMRSLPDNCKDIILTDPIYGINADELSKGLGNKVGKPLTSAGFKISDDTITAIELYETLAIESFRFTTSKAHGFIFVGPEHFWNLRSIFLQANWRVHVKPLIWIKRTTGQCNIPSAWPSSCYEMLMYIRKDDSRLIKEGQPDWFECNIISSTQKTHPFEKPVILLKNLLERISLPGQRLYDPFMGSGSSIEAGLELNLLCEGVDNSLEAYSVAVKRINDYTERKNKEEGR